MVDQWWWVSGGVGWWVVVVVSGNDGCGVAVVGVVSGSKRGVMVRSGGG